MMNWLRRRVRVRVRVRVRPHRQNYLSNSFPGFSIVNTLWFYRNIELEPTNRRRFHDWRDRVLAYPFQPASMELTDGN